jgi:hypothetical protein
MAMDLWSLGQPVNRARLSQQDLRAYHSLSPRKARFCSVPVSSIVTIWSGLRAISHTEAEQLTKDIS